MATFNTEVSFKLFHHFKLRINQYSIRKTKTNKICNRKSLIIMIKAKLKRRMALTYFEVQFDRGFI
jgi:hypothetical protein